MIKVGIVGANGYVGLELLRLLTLHPEVSLHIITSRSEVGTRVSDVFASLRGHIDLCFQRADADLLAACDVVFFATPHTVSMAMVPALIDRGGTRIIDLSADFRLKDVRLWERWYNATHVCPQIIDKAVYGLPEINREKIKSAQLVASPGCYPTASLLGFLPLLENGIIDRDHLIIDAKSGVSGAGRKAIMNLLLAESSENMRAYAVTTGHRHHPEIEQGLAAVAGQVDLTFVPHLVPMIRGIHTTLYGKVIAPTNLQALFEQRYDGEPYVDVLPSGSYPDTRSVRGANICRIAVHQPPDSDTVVVLSVIDNLVKGAAGQAIQTMNIMFGFSESLAINNIAIQP